MSNCPVSKRNLGGLVEAVKISDIQSRQDATCLQRVDGFSDDD